MDRYNKILIIKPSSLGDVVHSLPFLYSIRRTYPNASIHWVISKGIETLLEGHPLIDNVIVIHKDNWKKISRLISTLAELKTLFSHLRSEKYDLVVDLQGLFRSGIIAAATRSPVIIGFDEAREGSRIFYTHRIKGGRDLHAVDRYLKIAEFLGCRTDIVEFPFAPSEDHDLLQRHSLTPLDYAVFIPGARWETKRWPAERFGQVAKAFDMKVVLVGGNSDLSLAHIIQGVSPDNVISLVGRTSLPELIHILRDARFVLTNDTGPMHIAAALKRPVVALFGPTDAKRTGPYGSGNIIITSDAPCSPCFRKACQNTFCLTDITVDRVIDTLATHFENDRIFPRREAT